MTEHSAPDRKYRYVDIHRNPFNEEGSLGLKEYVFYLSILIRFAGNSRLLDFKIRHGQEAHSPYGQCIKNSIVNSIVARLLRTL